MPKRTDIHKILIIGAGPIVIGQACGNGNTVALSIDRSLPFCEQMLPCQELPE